MTLTRIELLRHGLPEGDECFRGHTDFRLTEKGFDQMRHAVSDLPVPDLVITSPLVRCRDFAKEYAAQKGIDLQVVDEIMELDFGDWDGKPKQQVWDEYQDEISAFWNSPWEATPPNGESLEEYDKRIGRAWKTLLEEHKGKSVLLVTHGGVMKQIIRLVLDMPKTATYLQRLNLAYAAKVKVTVYQDEKGKLWPELHWPS